MKKTVYFVNRSMCESDSTVYIRRDKCTVVPQHTTKPYDKLKVEFLSFFNKALT